MLALVSKIYPRKLYALVAQIADRLANLDEHFTRCDSVALSDIDC